jgi:hypothetical protein
MTFKVNVAVCSEIRTKHSTQGEHRVPFLNINPYPANVEYMVSSQ